VLAEGEFSASHVVFDDVVEPAVGGVGEKGFLLELADVEVELSADEVAFAGFGVALALLGLHFPNLQFLFI
jgi:hypothetical protein